MMAITMMPYINTSCGQRLEEHTDSDRKLGLILSNSIVVHYTCMYMPSRVAIPPPSAYRSSPVHALQRGPAPSHHPHVHSLVSDVPTNSKPLQTNSQASLSAPRPMHTVSYALCETLLCYSSTTSTPANYSIGFTAGGIACD